MAVQQPPAFSFYAKDFMLGTVTMSLAERGAYITLLAYQWDRGSVPTDPSELARVWGCSSKEARKLWAAIAVKFHAGDDGLWRNRRLEVERARQAEFRQRQSSRGQASAANRKATKPPTELQPEGNRAPTKPPLQPDVNQAPTKDPLQPEGNFPFPVRTPPNPPHGGLSETGLVHRDEVISAQAGEFLTRYVEIYAKARNGAYLQLKPARDHPYAMRLVAGWPDMEYLGKMAELFLRKSDWKPKNEPGTVGQFLHMAPQCDALLAQHGHRASRRVS